MEGVGRPPGPEAPPALVVMESPRAHLGPTGRLVLPRKFLTGLEAYASRWPGRLTALVRVASRPDDNLDHVEYAPSDWRFELRGITSEGVEEVEGGIGPRSLVLLALDKAGRIVADSCRRRGIPYVSVLEWSPRTRRQILWHEAPDPVRRLKRLLASEGDALAQRPYLRSAAGLQCNGTPAYEAHRRLNRRSMLFFDSRVTGDLVVGEAALERRLSGLLTGRPLRLVFSGRLIAIKGVRWLPRVAAALHRRGLTFSLDIFGGGALEGAVREQVGRAGLSAHVRLRGTLDFAKELMPFVRREADLFVCCHLQGDPSCTYLETLACGVPIAGFDNDLLRGLAGLSGAAWCVARNDPEELAALIARLDRDRGSLAEASRAARAFASGHTFEKTMERRIRHLLECCSQDPEGAPGGAFARSGGSEGGANP